MNTANTITDEQIRELRESVAPMSTPRPRHEHPLEEIEIINACDYALWTCNSNDPDAERIAGLRERARARCAEILNARRRRFFVADNQGITYSFVALDVDHCRAILVKHGCVFYAPDGGETSDIERADIEWTELTPEQSAIRMTSDDGAEDPALRRLPLSQRALGDWFCSEH